MPSEPTPSAPTRTAHVLIVDDECDIRDTMMDLLGPDGQECETASSGPEALQKLRAGSFDLVLLDVTMPEMSGLEVLREIRQTWALSVLPVVMVTGHNETAAAVEALEIGANDYVTKPVDLPLLLARIHTQLRLLQLSQLKDEFLRIASHDLKNPLTTILGGADFLLELVPVGATMTTAGNDLVMAIHRRAEEMHRLIKDFLDMQALDAGRLSIDPCDLDLTAIAEKVVVSQRVYGERKRIAVKLMCDGPTVTRGDPARVEQVMQNLVGNAIKFSQAGTNVLVRARSTSTSAIVEVEDEGPGLAPEDMGRLFRAYARLSAKPTVGEESSGHGLAICKRMIDLHGGRIGARNNTERGATFWFELPLAAA